MVRNETLDAQFCFWLLRGGEQHSCLSLPNKTLVCAKTPFHLCGIYQCYILKLLSQNLTRIHLIDA